VIGRDGVSRFGRSIVLGARRNPIRDERDLFRGKWVAADSGRTLGVLNPATEEVIATCPAGDAKDVDRAVRAATKAFYEGWKGVTAQERGRVLFRLAERIRARRAELAELETRNSGKPIAESEYDMDDTATCFEYYGGLATKINGEVLPGNQWVSPKSPYFQQKFPVPGRDVAKALKQYPLPVLNATISQRVAFAESARGRTVLELGRNSAASKEIKSLAKEVLKLAS